MAKKAYMIVLKAMYSYMIEGHRSLFTIETGLIIGVDENGEKIKEAIAEIIKEYVIY